MDIKKKREYINSLILKIVNCNDLNKFYEYSTGLYYQVNDLVYNFHSKILLEEKNESSKEEDGKI